MPNYTYDCTEGHTFDAITSFTEVMTCACGADTKRRSVYRQTMKMGAGAMPPEGDPEVYHQLEKAMKKTSYPPNRVYDELRGAFSRDEQERGRIDQSKMTHKVETRRS